MGRKNVQGKSLLERLTEQHKSYLNATNWVKFLEKLARGQEGGPQAKLPGAYCWIFTDRYSPQTKVIFSLGPYPISFQGGPRNEIKNQVKNQVTVKIAFDI